jgi:O-antigen/teichoic acid export membrane protein
MASEPAAAVALAGAAARRLAVVVLAGVCGIAVAAPEVGARLFGAPYAAAGPAIAVLAWGALFRATGGVILYAVTALGRQGALVVANLIAATAGVGLQLVLVPAMGLRGAALATIATAACGQAVLAFHPATRAVVRAVWGRVVVPAAIAALVVATVGRLRSDVTGGALAFVAYAAAVHVTRVVGRDDWGELARAVVGRRG